MRKKKAADPEASFDSGPQKAACFLIGVLIISVIVWHLRDVQTRTQDSVGISLEGSSSGTQPSALSDWSDVDLDVAGWESKIRAALAAKKKEPMLTPFEHIAPSPLLSEDSESMKQRVKSPPRQQNPTLNPLSVALTRDAVHQLSSLQSNANELSPSKSTMLPLDSNSRRVVFIKTYKTGSTTVAMFMNAVGYQLKLRMLHPLDKGWFTVSSQILVSTISTFKLFVTARRA